MRWSRANLEEKQEPRAATSGSAERHAKGIWHDVTRKSLTEAAIEKPTFSPEGRLSAGILVNICWLFAGSALARFFRHERTSRAINMTFAVSLILSVVVTVLL